MTIKKTYSTPQKLLYILLGALLMGMLWRIRGTHGWGSSWGLLNAGFLFTMFIVIICGERKKLSIGWLGIVSLVFMLTVPAWGTLLGQITGVLFDPTDFIDFPGYTGETTVYCSVPSAIFIMLCLGFGLASLFGIFLGACYSGKQWKVKDYVILLAAFFATDLIAKATVSHLIIAIVQPEAAEIFEEGLKLTGIETGAWKTYLQHIDDTSWAKKLLGGRNYYAEVEMISFAIKSVVSLIVTRFAIKDKVAAKTGLVVCSAFAFSITISDLFFYFGNGGYHMLNENYFSDFIAPWSCWEYFTGFIAGGIITAHMLSLKPEKDVYDKAFINTPKMVSDSLNFLLGYVALLGISIVRPVLERFDEVDYQAIVTVAAVIAAIAFVAILTKKWGMTAQKTNMTTVCKTLLPIMVAFEFIVYMFVGCTTYPNYTAINGLHTILVVVSTVILLIWSALSYKKIKTK